MEIKADVSTLVTFTNKKLTSLETKKISDNTGESLSNAKFVAEKQNGKQIREYTTDKAGSISIPELSLDWYVIKRDKVEYWNKKCYHLFCISCSFILKIFIFKF